MPLPRNQLVLKRWRRVLLVVGSLAAIAFGGRTVLQVWRDHAGYAGPVEVVTSPADVPATPIVSGVTNGPTPQHTGRYTLLALGDSYTIGQSIDPAGRWPVQLAARLREQHLDVTDPDILARTGWTTADLLSAMDHTNLAANPLPAYDEVLLLIGVNNQYRGMPLDTYRDQFHTLLARSILLARGDPRRVIVLSIPDYGVTPFGHAGNPARIATELTAFNASAQTLCTAAGVAFVNITPASEHASTEPTLTAADGLHPSAQQYAQWVDLALPAAKAALEIATTRP